jgi:hypothetical protein
MLKATQPPDGKSPATTASGISCARRACLDRQHRIAHRVAELDWIRPSYALA